MANYILLLLIVIVFLSHFVLIAETNGIAETRCKVPVAAPKNIAKIINKCQDEIKAALLSEAVDLLNDAVFDSEHLHNRRKREAFSEEERRIAGCLLQCVYRKMEAVNTSGFPIAEGLITLYTEGVTERNYVLATHQAVHTCLYQAQTRHLPKGEELTDNGKTCDIAFDVFDCVSNRIGQYCGQPPY